MPAMKISRLALAAALGLAHAAHGADLLSIYRDAMVSDPVYQSARAQYAAGVEKLPQARAGYLPLIAGSASIAAWYCARADWYTGSLTMASR